MAEPKMLWSTLAIIWATLPSWLILMANPHGQSSGLPSLGLHGFHSFHGLHGLHGLHVVLEALGLDGFAGHGIHWQILPHHGTTLLE